jgi:hypothetical protein
MAKPHKTTVSFFIIFRYTFRVHSQILGVGPKSCLFPTLYVMGNRHPRLSTHPAMSLHQQSGLVARKNGGCRDSAGDHPTLSLQPLSQVCVAEFTLPEIIPPHNGTKVGRPLSVSG